MKDALLKVFDAAADSPTGWAICEPSAELWTLTQQGLIQIFMTTGDPNVYYRLTGEGERRIREKPKSGIDH